MKLSISLTSPNQEYDLIIACCGYESRSRKMVEAKAFEGKRRVAIGYGDLERLAFVDNLKFFRGRKFEFAAIADSDFPDFMRELLQGLGSSRPLVLLDISCFTRIRLAQIVEALSELDAYVLDVFYSLADFVAPSSREPANEHLGPVSPYFSGWTGNADRAVGLVCGLGYEQLKALGVIEYIDPFETWLFFPTSSIPSYDAAVDEANTLLMREVPPSNVVRYPVLDGDILMRKLLALVGAVRQDFRCILMPLGPKMFAFAALLVGTVFRDVSVWRASSGRFAMPRDRKASADFAEFRVVWKAVEEASLPSP